MFKTLTLPQKIGPRHSLWLEWFGLFSLCFECAKMQTCRNAGKHAIEINIYSFPSEFRSRPLHILNFVLMACFHFMQVVIGSAPGTDGNFQKTPGFQAVVINGQTTLTYAATAQYNQSVAYVIPASKCKPPFALAAVFLLPVTISSWTQLYDLVAWPGQCCHDRI